MYDSSQRYSSSDFEGSEERSRLLREEELVDCVGLDEETEGE